MLSFACLIFYCLWSFNPINSVIAFAVSFSLQRLFDKLFSIFLIVISSILIAIPLQLFHFALAIPRYFNRLSNAIELI